MSVRVGESVKVDLKEQIKMHSEPKAVYDTIFFPSHVLKVALRNCKPGITDCEMLQVLYNAIILQNAMRRKTHYRCIISRCRSALTDRVSRNDSDIGTTH